MNKKRILAVLSAVFLTACGGADPATLSKVSAGGVTPAAGEAATEKTAETEDAVAPVKEEVIAAINSEPGSGWDPVTGYGQRYDPILQSTLTKAYGGEISNDLAEEYFVSDDGLDWTFRIRDDAYFCNGEKLVAGDVAFTYEAVRDGGTSLDLSNIRDAEAIDDTTVVFHLNSPDYTFLYTTYKVGIVPEAHYDGNYGENPIGSGPFKLVEWEKGQQCIWEYNEYYYGKEPSIKRIVLLFMDDDAAFMAAQRGDVDLVYTNQNLATQTIDGYRMEAIESIDNYGIIFPTTMDEGKTSEDGRPVGNNVTGDVNIRRALSVGIDREALIRDVFNGYGIASYSMCDTMPWFNEETALNAENSGTDKAIAILEEGGWIDTDGDGVREKDGLKAEFTLFYTASNANRQAMAMAIAEQAKALGIAISPEGGANADFNDRLFTTPYMFGRGDYTPNEFYLMNSTNTRGAGWSNSSFYSNPDVDRYMELAMGSRDLEDVYKYYKLAQWDGKSGASLIGDAPAAWYVRADHCYFVRDGLNIGNQPVQPHCANGQVALSNICDWYWE
ncbi:MAG: ABC transporter substrate-binding protein [Lachnospiraceae bacterium]|nr:ABC transporter substrate-binding protein [Lachnospiraceae bacterium]